MGSTTGRHEARPRSSPYKFSFREHLGESGFARLALNSLAREKGQGSFLVNSLPRDFRSLMRFRARITCYAPPCKSSGRIEKKIDR